MKGKDSAILLAKLLSKYIIFITIIVCTATIFNGCYLFPREEETLAPPLVEPDKVTYETTDVKKGTIENVVTGSGTIASSNEQNIYYKFRGGYLKGIYTRLGDKINKGDVIAELDTDSLTNDIKKQKIMLEKAELDLQNIKDNGGKTIDIKKAGLDVELQKITLQDLEVEYDKSRLISPITGYVVYLDKLNAGDYVNANKTLVKVADPSNLLVQVPYTDSSQYVVGNKIEVDYNDKVYQGKVVMTPATAPLDAGEELKKIIQIKVEGLPSDVRIGDSVNTRLVVARKENAIIIPRSTITSGDGRSYVQVLANGVKYERDVEIGIENATEAEIVKGLKEGEKVILR